MVHPSAVIGDGADLAAGVQVGPFAVIGANVVLGPGTRVGAHAVIEGRTRIGANSVIGPHAVIGAPPQIRGCGEPGELVIGEGNLLREFCTVHAGSLGSTTTIGDANMLMAYSHVAHDCQLGSGIELANNVQLAGHVQVGDRAVLGGLAAVHQFVRIGAYGFVGAGAIVVQDVPPFCQVAGDRARLYGLNVVGLRRHGFDAQKRRALAAALRLLRQASMLAEALQAVRARPELIAVDAVEQLLQFAETSSRGLCRPVGNNGRTTCTEDD